MTEPDRCSTDGTPENETEADSGTQNDNHSTEEGEAEADQSVQSPKDECRSPKAESRSPNASSVPDQALNTNYDSSDGAIPVHRCDHCDNYETLTRAALLTHLSRCTGAESESSPSTEPNNRKIFECDVCNMKFSNGANMRRHKMRHTGVKPYECRVCQKRFFRKDHLAEHFTTHNKTLPYHCPICNRGFQRQIAMRAHFQNEHVGQHDMIKSCPLCSYRAGSMKSLRVHFFNRHGIDLDNPGPGGPGLSSLLPGGGQLSPLEMSCHMGLAATYSDSGDSLGARSVDNATPPMHFLTPHVEISMADAPPASYSPAQCGGDSDQPNQASSHSNDQSRMNGDSPDGSPHSGDSNSNTPSSSHINSRLESKSDMNNITPSISLIPIKQEPGTEAVNLSTARGGEGANSMTQFQSATSSSLTNLIKVSPLKSLLREDLKRKITSRNAASRVRSTTNSPRPESTFTLQPIATTTNGTITSTGPEQPSDSTYRGMNHKKSLQCIFCGIGFPDQTLYFLHKGCHSDSNPWKCNICGEQCSNVYEFNSHLLSKTHQ